MSLFYPNDSKSYLMAMQMHVS